MPRKAASDMEPEKVLPAYKASLGPLQLAIWANEHQTKEGDTRVFHTISIERNFMDKNDTWQKTHQLREGDLGDAIALLQNAQGFLIKEGGSAP